MTNTDEPRPALSGGGHPEPESTISGIEYVLTPPSQAYANAALIYVGAGWRGVLPIDDGRDPWGATRGKHRPPAGYTGEKNADKYPPMDQVHKWARFYGHLNVGLRLPRGVVGIDVDAYDGKKGDQTLAELEARLGLLPATWSSTSRGEGPSRIRFYRVAEDIAWHDIGGDIEIIRHEHRFAVVWPSVHPSGRTYEWYDADGNVSDRPPQVNELAVLPDTWQSAARAGTLRPQTAASGSTASVGSSGQAVDVDALLRGESLPGKTHRESLISLIASLWARNVSLGAIRVLLRQAAKPQRSDEPWTDRELEDLLLDWTAKHVPGIALDPELMDWAKNLGKSAGVPDEMTDELTALTVKRLVWHIADRAARRKADSFDGRSSASAWASVDDIVTQVLDGGVEPDRPGVLKFEDDPERGVFYEGRYNTMWGPEGVGKSLLLAHLQVTYVNAGQHVVHLEYDNNSAAQVIRRLLLAGARPDAIREYFHIPESPGLSVPALDITPALVTIDSVNAAISLMDSDANSSSKAMDTFIRLLVEPFTSQGATVVGIDHSGHDHLERPSNNRRKLQAVQGIGLQVERLGAGRIGTRWMSRLIVRKDNPGGAAANVDDELGVVVFDGTAGNGTYQVSLLAQAPLADLATVNAQRLDDNVERLLKRLGEDLADGERTGNALKEYLSMSRATFNATVERTGNRVFVSKRGQTSYHWLVDNVPNSEPT